MSRLAVLSLRNRALVALATIAVLVFGLISAGSLKQELIPSLQIPAAAVVAAQPGASPDVVERQVVLPLEQAISTVDGVVATTSTASTGLGTVTVELEYGSDLDRATAALQTAVSRVQAQLPADVEPQVLAGSLADLPVVQLAIAAPGDAAALSDRIEAAVVPLFEQVEGVRDVTVTGASEPRVQIALDAAALAAAGIPAAAVTTVLEENGVVLPAGTVTEGEQTLSVQAGDRLTSVEELRAVPLTGADGAVVPLGEVATVELGEAPATSYSRVDGQPALSVGLTQTPDGNTVDISNAVADLLPQVRELLGAGSTVAVVFDQAPFIEESIEGLATEGGLGLLFALVVILVFLGSVRSTLISAISIPVSLCVTFIGLQVAGFSLNILTLGALTVSIGRVVDDSIVVIENIKRHLSYGEGRTRAILGGVREVAGAITSSTIATAAVFLPIALVGGLVGELFRPFALTVAIALLASLVVSLTIVPVIASAFLKAPETDREETAELAREREAAEAVERRTWLQRLYVPALRGVLAHRRWTVAGALAVFVGTLALTPLLQTNFIGDAGEDTVTVTAAYPAGTSLAAQDERARVLEEALGELAGVETVQTTVGSAGGFAAFNGGGGTPTATFSLTLAEDGGPEETRAEIRTVAGDLADVGDVTVAAAGSGFGSSTVDVLVQAADANVLADAADQVQQAVAEVPGATDVTNDLSAGLPVVRVDVDPVAAAQVGLTQAQVTRTLAGLTNAVPLGEIDVDDATTPVYLDPVQAPETVEQLRAVVLPTAGGLVPLTQLATVEEAQAPSSITRVDGERSATVSATPADADLGALTTALQAAIDDLELPAGAEVSIGGVAADQGEAFADLGLALVIAVVIVYLVMVATFRSLAQPFILLVSVPFAATGALLMLLVTGTPLGVPALIGVLMLIGIVVTNAIVLIDLVNQYRERGRPLAEAVSEGARQRLRPIVMTAAATVLALTPMAFGLTGGGVFISQPLALVVIGGLISSTVLTLLLVPVLYTSLETRRERRAAKRAGAGQSEPAVEEELQPA
ncbi:MULTISPECIES: efflux RND transporter permease subunit [unclassified Modestobacter]|uniref:efflux RND transporter permease subunit n=1 Tax=unclassified Modestobacter TaxID=2643866 RepID=UPI0022AA1847|nr:MULTISPECIES: efflux RND transporter permease subunit [unclassified Modestobacter]MCZ2826490.1 efflux RND transporter permease subunit [Modestobacter sp. VKM Ac-2981]MCZ2852445.1 efflux RND transporter permease subunit [Modestobacter sp. VKM Ac-2982]